MAEPARACGLLAWALGSFHASFFVLIVIAAPVTTGGIAGLLGGLNTLLGFALFALLWSIVWWATNRGLTGFEFSNLERVDVGGLLGRAFVWGGVAGVFFLLGLAALVLAVNLAGVGLALARGEALLPSPDALAVVLLFGIGVPVAGLVAFVIGALVGGILGILDAAGLIGARLLIRLASRPRQPNEGPA